MIRKGIKPGFTISFDLPGVKAGFRRVLPFKRSWVAIFVLAAMDVAFTLPAVFTLSQAVSEWKNFDSLSDLVAALFLSAWLLGWAIAPLLFTGILLIMLFGREVLKASPGHIEIFLGVPFVGIAASYDSAKVRNLRFNRPPKKSGTSWRGTHLVFDYGANSVALGSGIDADDVGELRAQLETATGATIRRGPALPDETQAQWDADQSLPVEPPVADIILKHQPLSLTSPSSLMLIIANLTPVAGHVWLNWNLADVMVLYWAESAVIGFFNIGKIITISRWGALLAGPFFVGHFGAFMAVHFLFIYTIFIEPATDGTMSRGELADVAQLFIDLWPALLALFISHAFSFYNNFLGRKAYRGRTVNDQMSEPYSRIIFMHIVLIFGGGLSMAMGGPAVVLLIVIALKIYFDLKAHMKQHTGSASHATHL